jgi:hypothetical protein
MIETIRIGHMMYPPLMKLSTRKFPVAACPVPGNPAGGGVAVAATGGAIEGAVAGVIPAAGDNPGIPAGLIPGTAGARAGLVVVVAGIVVVGAVAAGAVVTGAVVAGEPAAAGGGEVWPNEFRTNVSEQSETVSSVFIG